MFLKHLHTKSNDLSHTEPLDFTKIIERSKDSYAHICSLTEYKRSTHLNLEDSKYNIAAHGGFQLKATCFSLTILSRFLLLLAVFILPIVVFKIICETIQINRYVSVALAERLHDTFDVLLSPEARVEILTGFQVQTLLGEQKQDFCNPHFDKHNPDYLSTQLKNMPIKSLEDYNKEGVTVAERTKLIKNIKWAQLVKITSGDKTLLAQIFHRLLQFLAKNQYSIQGEAHEMYDYFAYNVQSFVSSAQRLGLSLSGELSNVSDARFKTLYQDLLINKNHTKILEQMDKVIKMLHDNEQKTKEVQEKFVDPYSKIENIQDWMSFKPKFLTQILAEHQTNIKKLLDYINSCKQYIADHTQENNFTLPLVSLLEFTEHMNKPTPAEDFLYKLETLAKPLDLKTEDYQSLKNIGNSWNYNNAIDDLNTWCKTIADDSQKMVENIYWQTLEKEYQSLNDDMNTEITPFNNKITSMQNELAEITKKLEIIQDYFQCLNDMTKLKSQQAHNNTDEELEILRKQQNTLNNKKTNLEEKLSLQKLLTDQSDLQNAQQQLTGKQQQLNQNIAGDINKLHKLQEQQVALKTNYEANEQLNKNYNMRREAQHQMVDIYEFMKDFLNKTLTDEATLLKDIEDINKHIQTRSGIIVACQVKSQTGMLLSAMTPLTFTTAHWNRLKQINQQNTMTTFKLISEFIKTKTHNFHIHLHQLVNVPQTYFSLSHIYENTDYENTEKMVISETGLQALTNKTTTFDINAYININVGTLNNGFDAIRRIQAKPEEHLDLNEALEYLENKIANKRLVVTDLDEYQKVLNIWYTYSGKILHRLATRTDAEKHRLYPELHDMFKDKLPIGEDPQAKLVKPVNANQEQTFIGPYGYIYPIKDKLEILGDSGGDGWMAKIWSWFKSFLSSDEYTDNSYRVTLNHLETLKFLHENNIGGLVCVNKPINLVEQMLYIFFCVMGALIAFFVSMVINESIQMMVKKYFEQEVYIKIINMFSHLHPYFNNMTQTMQIVELVTVSISKYEISKINVLSTLVINALGLITMFVVFVFLQSDQYETFDKLALEDGTEEKAYEEIKTQIQNMNNNKDFLLPIGLLFLLYMGLNVLYIALSLNNYSVYNLDLSQEKQVVTTNNKLKYASSIIVKLIIYLLNIFFILMITLNHFMIFTSCQHNEKLKPLPSDNKITLHNPRTSMFKTGYIFKRMGLTNNLSHLLDIFTYITQKEKSLKIYIDDKFPLSFILDLAYIGFVILLHLVSKAVAIKMFSKEFMEFVQTKAINDKLVDALYHSIVYLNNDPAPLVVEDGRKIVNVQKALLKLNDGIIYVGLQHNGEDGEDDEDIVLKTRPAILKEVEITLHGVTVLIGKSGGGKTSIVRYLMGMLYTERWRVINDLYKAHHGKNLEGVCQNHVYLTVTLDDGTSMVIDAMKNPGILKHLFYYLPQNIAAFNSGMLKVHEIMEIFEKSNKHIYNGQKNYDTTMVQNLLNKHLDDNNTSQELLNKTYDQEQTNAQSIFDSLVSSFNLPKDVMERKWSSLSGGQVKRLLMLLRICFLALSYARPRTQ